MEELEKIYADVPGVPCIAGCTGCCVSPTMTLVEFIHVMKQVYQQNSEEEILGIIQKPMKAHPWFSGNFYCRFQQPDGFCGVHQNRALACRLHGLPVIEKFGIDNLENCTIMDKQFLPKVEKDATDAWLERLLTENEKIFEHYRENFYGLLAFNVECWLDLLYQEGVVNEMFLELQTVLRQNLPWEKKGLTYSPHSDLSEKMEAISLLDMVMKTSDAESTYQLLLNIQNNFERTGSYYLAEARWMEKKVVEKTSNLKPPP